MSKIYAYDRKEQKTALIIKPATGADMGAHEAGSYLPMLTWADWELLQELHKAREASHLCQDEGCDHHGTPHVCVSRVVHSKQVASVADETIGAYRKPQLNKDAIIADLQDQIKDWGRKCTHLEGDINQLRHSLETAIQIKIKYAAENAELSKSLQHYRQAYFADQGKEVIMKPFISEGDVNEKP